MSRGKIFISHASQDHVPAGLICAGLEAVGLRCWIAPRDIIPGSKGWPSQIAAGIETSDCLLVLISDRSNRSRQVEREVVIADNKGLPIVPVCIENISPSGGLEFLTGSAQRVNAFHGPIETHLSSIAEAAAGVAPDHHILQHARSVMQQALPTLVTRRWRMGLTSLRGLSYTFATNRQLSVQKSKQVERALEIADAMIAQATRNNRRLLPRIFRLEWPPAARVEAILLFPFLAYLVRTHVVEAMDWIIIQSTASRASSEGIQHIAAVVGIPGILIDCVIYILPVPLAWFGCLVLTDRLLALPKGLAIVSIAVLPIWSLIAASLTRALQFELPRHLLANSLPHVTSAEVMGSLAFVSGLCIHSRAIWMGMRDNGFFARNLRYKRLTRKMQI